MAHYFAHEERLGPPFKYVRELKMVVPGSGERRQLSRFPKILFLLDGECTVRMVNGFRASLKPGDVLVVPEPCHHHYLPVIPGVDSEVHFFGLYFDRMVASKKHCSPQEVEWFSLMANFFSKLAHYPASLNLNLLALINSFREEQSSRRVGSLVKQRSLCMELVVELARHLSAPTQKVETAPGHRTHAFIASEVKEFLGKTIQRRHTLPGIAWRFKLSEEHLSRLFKKETGFTVMGYLRKIRVETAMKMLLGTHHTVASLGTEIGFASSNHFCRAFVQQIGMTPREYRQKHAGLNDPKDWRKLSGRR